jgi:hypothetical protein
MCPKEKEWGNKHQKFIEMWNRRKKLVDKDGTMYGEADYLKHLAWHQEQHRVKLKPAWSTQDLLDLGNEDGDNEYNLAVRRSAGTPRDYAPVFDRAVCTLLNVNIDITYLKLAFLPCSIL